MDEQLETLRRALSDIDTMNADDLRQVVKKLFELATLQNAKITMQDTAILRMSMELKHYDDVMCMLHAGMATLHVRKPSSKA